MKYDLIDLSSGPNKDLTEIKEFVRANEDDTLSLIRLVPMINDDQDLVPHMVLYIVDDEQPVIMDRMTASILVSASSYEPLALAAHYKHRTEH